MKLISIHTVKSTFEIPEDFIKTIQEVPGQNTELQIKHGATLNQKADEGKLIVSLQLLLNKIQVFSHVAGLQLEEIPDTFTLTDVVSHSQMQPALLRHWGSVVNNVNWLMMNSPIGPLPIHAHLIHDIFLQMVKNQKQEQALA